MTDYEIRPLSGRDEYLACVQLQRETWGESFSELVPSAILWASQQTGGVAAGAFDREGRLQGFVFGISGVRDGTLVHWSDMLAVRPEVRNSGLGVQLKRYQRDVLLERGIETVYWTFDPLEARNAYINFARLGVTAKRYIRDAYGESGATLHAGIGTDRLVAEWGIGSERVAARLAAPSGARPEVDSTIREAPLVNDTHVREGLLYGDAPRLDIDAPAVRVAIPADVQALKARDLALARDWREKTKAALEAYLGRGYVAVEFMRERERGCYLLALAPFES